MSKREFVRRFYKDYVESQQSELGKNVTFIIFIVFILGKDVKTFWIIFSWSEYWRHDTWDVQFANWIKGNSKSKKVIQSQL